MISSQSVFGTSKGSFGKKAYGEETFDGLYFLPFCLVIFFFC